MDFKFFRNEKTATFNLAEYEMGHSTFQIYRYNPENVEFCFQFGDEEPVVFATGPNECSIRLTPTAEGNITFNNNGNVFKLFARERQND